MARLTRESEISIRQKNLQIGRILKNIDLSSSRKRKGFFR
jgi:hypothetical protein